MKSLELLSLLSSFVLPVAACGDATCVDVGSRTVTDPSTPLLIGGTYGELLTDFVGERSGTARWRETDASVRGLPPPGETGIIVTIHEPSTATEVDLMRRGGRGERLYCPDELQAESAVEVRSDDGALDASLLVPIAFQTSHGFTTTVDVTEEDIGAIELGPIDEDARLLLTLSYRAGAAPSGTLRLRTTEDDSGTGVGMSVDLLTWTLE
jgi:hypothetical protein